MVKGETVKIHLVVFYTCSLLSATLVYLFFLTDKKLLSSFQRQGTMKNSWGPASKWSELNSL